MAPVEQLRRLDPHPPLRVEVRVLQLEPPGDRACFSTRLLDRDAGFETSEGSEPAPVSILPNGTVERERLPQLRARWENEVFAHDADDGVLHAVEQDAGPDDATVAAESSLP